MSKEHQKYHQKQTNIQKKGIYGSMNVSEYKNDIYYPFQIGQQNYYYNYMYPFPEPSYLPYYPPQYLPPFHPPTYNQLALRPKTQQRDNDALKKAPVKSEPVYQKEFYIKLQQDKPKQSQITEKQIPSKTDNKKNVQQLYMVGLNQDPSKYTQQQIAELLDKFKKVVEAHINQNIEHGEDFNSYQELFGKQIKQDQIFFSELMNVLAQRFQNFKKTKEELIKFIIRRTYHNLKINKTALCEKPEYERLQAFHQRNLTTFKSMNIQFLKRQFSNQLFVQLFRELLETIDQQFQRENSQKVQRFSFILVNCWIQKSTSLLVHERKLPWVNTYKQKIKRIAQELLREHEGSKL